MADGTKVLNFTRSDGVVHAFDYNGTEILPTNGWMLLKAKCGRKAKHSPENGRDRTTNDSVTCIECLGFPE